MKKNKIGNNWNRSKVFFYNVTKGISNYNYNTNLGLLDYKYYYKGGLYIYERTTINMNTKNLDNF